MRAKISNATPDRSMCRVQGNAFSPHVTHACSHVLCVRHQSIVEWCIWHPQVTNHQFLINRAEVHMAYIDDRRHRTPHSSHHQPTSSEWIYYSMPTNGIHLKVSPALEDRNWNRFAATMPEVQCIVLWCRPYWHDRRRTTQVMTYNVVIRIHN